MHTRSHSTCRRKANDAVTTQPTYVPDACPECAVGKHDTCDGVTWDRARDEPAPCPCDEMGHGND
jgi:hypothetical protein